jgi:hypothetical protein
MTGLTPYVHMIGLTPAPARSKLVEGWIEACKQRGIPVASDSSLRGTLASPVEVWRAVSHRGQSSGFGSCMKALDRSTRFFTSVVKSLLFVLSW